MLTGFLCNLDGDIVKIREHDPIQEKESDIACDVEVYDPSDDKWHLANVAGYDLDISADGDKFTFFDEEEDDYEDIDFGDYYPGMDVAIFRTEDEANAFVKGVDIGKIFGGNLERKRIISILGLEMEYL